MAYATHKFDEQPIERRAEIVKNMTAEKLLTAYDIYVRNFDPLDDDLYESYTLIRNEILRRCAKD